ncbi:hypothetical protein OHC33_004124 [Knufia fluminis]|uniref:Uncharacterized protein n=1 Tax=Knufia fluminis TaxID=191047 RepID=A0AAN8EMM9_9EURO|nr:hypothetical protein OHC33_004124 [Knufia fluminis]
MKMPFPGHKKSVELFARGAAGSDSPKIQKFPVLESPASPIDTSEDEYSDDSGEEADYCKQYLRAGNCASISRGCHSSHRIPRSDSPRLWKKLGFSDVPEWLRARSNQDRSWYSQPRRLTKKGNPMPERGEKLYCTFFLETGRCRYTRPGCRYSHEVPDLGDIELWQAIGFSEVPQWLRSRLSKNQKFTKKGNRLPEPNTKVYCDHFLRTEYCRFAQEGCMYSHDVPDLDDLELWQAIGFTDVPQWLRFRATFTEHSPRQSRREGRAVESDGERLIASDDSPWPVRQPPSGPRSQQMDISPPPLRRDSGRVVSFNSREQAERHRHSSSAMSRPGRERFEESDVYRPPYEQNTDRAANHSRERNGVRPRRRSNGYDNQEPQREQLHVASHKGPNHDEALSSAALVSGSTVKLNPSRQDVEKATTGVRDKQQATPTQRGDESHRTYYGNMADTTAGSHRNSGDVAEDSTAQGDRNITPGISIRGLASKTTNTSTDPDTPAVGVNQPPEATVSVEITRPSTAEAAEPQKHAGFNYLAALYPSENHPHSGHAEKTRTLSPYDRKRASNTPSSDLTTSSRSSSLKKKCSSCKKPESNYQLLVPCTTCPRKYHSICGDPRPNMAPKGSFVCGRCIEKRKAGAKDKALVPCPTAGFRNDDGPAFTPVDAASAPHGPALSPPQTEGLPSEPSLHESTAAKDDMEPDCSDKREGTKYSAKVTPMSEHESANGHLKPSEPTKLAGFVPETSVNVSKLSAASIPEYENDSCQVAEETPRTSAADHQSEHQIPAVPYHRPAATGIGLSQGSGSSKEPSQAPQPRKDGITASYDGSHEAANYSQKSWDDDKENMRDMPPTAPKAMRERAALSYDGSQELLDRGQATWPGNKTTSGHAFGRRMPPDEYEPKPYLIHNPLVFEGAQEDAVRYKNVTCPWWVAGNTCKRREEDCMFAHRRTGIESPHGTRRAKYWTCPKWHAAQRSSTADFVESCPWTPDECLYAHEDTGYYVGLDGKARKKHLTCHWFYHRGWCDKTSEQCLFAHCWTGLVAEEPASKPARSSLGRYDDRHYRPAATEIPTVSRSSVDVTQGRGIYDAADTQSPVQETPSTAMNLRQTHASQPSRDTVVASSNTNDAAVPRPTQNIFVEARATADPRQRKSRQSDVAPELSATEDGTPIDSTTEKPDMQMSEPALAATPVQRPPETQRKASTGAGVRECRSCGKKIMGRDTCIACQKPDEEADQDSPVATASGQPKDSGKARHESTGSADIDVELACPIEDIDFNDVSIVPRATKKVLKRAASGSRLFTSNKRFRPNPPAAPLRESKVKVVLPTLEEITTAERVKRAEEKLVNAKKDEASLSRKGLPGEPEINPARFDAELTSIAFHVPGARSSVQLIEDPTAPQALQQSTLAPLNETVDDQTEISTSQIPQATSPTSSHDDDNEILEDIEHSTTDLTAGSSRTMSTFYSASQSLCSDEESEMPLALLSKQHKESARKKSKQENLWSSSTNNSQEATTTEPVKIPAPSKLPNGRFDCPFSCGQTFSAEKHATRHAADLHANVIKYQCEVCSKGFYRKDKYQDHVKTHPRKKTGLSKQSAANVHFEEIDQGIEMQGINSPKETAEVVGKRSVNAEETDLREEPELGVRSDASLSDSAFSIESETEPEDEEMTDKETDKTAESTNEKQFPREVEEAADSIPPAPASATPQVLSSDEDETDSDESGDESERSCKDCTDRGTGGKCLHDARGRLDGRRCDDYVSERVARNIRHFPSGEAWRTIEDAALQSRPRGQVPLMMKRTEANTGKGIRITPETITFQNPGSPTTMDSEAMLEIRNHSLSDILFKVQIQPGPCEQEWEAGTNWGQIDADHTISVYIRRKINSLRIRYQKLRLDPVQYPEYITVSYTPISSGENGSRVNTWSYMGEHKIRVPVKCVEAPVFSDVDDSNSSIEEASDLDKADGEGRESNEGPTLSAVKINEPAKKIPVVLVPPRKSTAKSQTEQPPKLTLKFSANARSKGPIPTQRQAHTQSTATTSTNDVPPVKPGRTQVAGASGKERDDSAQARPVKKINLRMGPAPVGSPAGASPGTKAQHRRTASQINNTEKSPQQRSREAATFDVTEEEMPKALGKSDARKPTQVVLQHRRTVSNSTNQSSRPPQKARQPVKSNAPSPKLLASIARLKFRGVKFEEPDTDEEEYEAESANSASHPSEQTRPPLEPLQSFLTTRDPQNLYYKPSNSLLPPTPSLPLPKITKGQGLKIPSSIRHRQMLRNLWLHGNAHKECNRELPQSEVYAMVERKVPDANDKWAPDTLQVREEKISFREFCGVGRGAEVEACLVGMGDGVRLAWRERGEGGTAGAGMGVGRRKRVADGEKWGVSER